jgi:hypothetical protein
MSEFHLGTQQITFSYNCMYQIHNMFLTPDSQLQNHPILTAICCRYIELIKHQPS